MNFDAFASDPAARGPSPSPRKAAGEARRKRPTPPDQPEDRSLRRRLTELEKELADAFYAFYEERLKLTGLDGAARPATLELSLKISPPEGAAAPPEQLHRQIKDAAVRFADRSSAFPSGRVYCYWCRSFGCPHASPPGPRSVFSAYSPTGQPLWHDFSSVLLERGDPRIETLFREENRAPISLVQSGGELAARQLGVYGKRSPIYRILGQIALGYLVPPRAHNGARAPFAVTIQAVEAAGGSSLAHLNILGVLADGTAAAQALDEFFDPRIVDAIVSTRRRLAEIALAKIPRRRRAREQRRRVLDALRLLAKNFDRIFRQGRRRTRHSQDRHRNRRRPASVALRDALHADSASIYRDVEEHTWVVVGPKNRVHIFNDHAMHVTSIVYPGDTIRGRTTRGKWISPRRAEIQAFLDALRRRSAGEKE